MYTRALGLKKNDPFPQQKLNEIAGLIKAEEDFKKKQVAYNAKVTEAETAAKAGNIQNAITLFEQAKTIKPDETLPDNRITELGALAEGNNAAQQALQARYQEFMTAGATAETGKDYTTALARYKDALSVKAKDKAAQDKIAEMQQVLDNEAKLDAKRAEIQKLIAKADAKFDEKSWASAKGLYESVLTLDPQNKYSIDRIAECDRIQQKESTAEVEKEYQKILRAAEKLQAADVARKNGRQKRFRKGVDRAVEKSDSLMLAREATNAENNTLLGTVAKENSEAYVIADGNRQDNIGTLKEIDGTIKATELENGMYENAENLDAKNQIDIANRIQQEQSGILDGYAANNDELLKASKKELENETGNDNAATYERRLNNETEYMKVQLDLEADAIDDFADRVATEHIVRDASNSVVEVTQD